MKIQVTVMLAGLLGLAGGCVIEGHVGGGVDVAVDAPPPPVVVYEPAVPPPIVIEEYYYVGGHYYYWYPDRRAYVVIGGFPPMGFRVERFDHLPRRDHGGHIAEHIHGTEFHPPAHGPARPDYGHSAPPHQPPASHPTDVTHQAPPHQVAPPHATPQKVVPQQHSQGHPQPHSDKKKDDDKPAH